MVSLLLIAVYSCSIFVSAIRIPGAVDLLRRAYISSYLWPDVQIALVLFMLPSASCVTSIILFIINDGELIGYGLHMHVFTFAFLTYHDWVRDPLQSLPRTQPTHLRYAYAHGTGTRLQDPSKVYPWIIHNGARA
jgi:hypothetical protein